MQLTTYLVSDEINYAKLLWLKDNQICLKGNANYDELVKKLNLQEDDSGIVRSFSRLINADIPFDTKAPIMLSKDHKLAEMFVRSV